MSKRSAPEGAATAAVVVETGVPGGAGTPTLCTRAGYLPVPLEHVPPGAFVGLHVYLRTGPETTARAVGDGFTLYRHPDLPFTHSDQQRLIDGGVRFVYVRIADQQQLRIQTEQQLIELISDPEAVVAETSQIVYETSVALIDEVLADRALAETHPRVEGVAKAITTLVINNREAFGHLFSVSHHDFYTATHCVNVATWMVPLAFSMGYRDPELLAQVCQGGLLHDLGKVYVPAEILNKKERLSTEDWAVIQRHPERGSSDLATCGRVPTLVMQIVHEHHERMDGSGYPRGLEGSQIHPLARICSVIDSFDAMTAFRPHKQKPLAIQEAVQVLKAETPSKYDPEVVKAWLGLLGSSRIANVSSEIDGFDSPISAANRRRQPRYPLHCAARVHVLRCSPKGWRSRRPIAATATNISRSGLGLLCEVAIPADERVRVYLDADGWRDGKYLEGQTVRCRGFSDHWYDIGIRLLAKSEEAATLRAEQAN